MKEADETDSSVKDEANLISSGHFQMPYDIVRDGESHSRCAP